MEAYAKVVNQKCLVQFRFSMDLIMLVFDNLGSSISNQSLRVDWSLVILNRMISTM